MFQDSFDNADDRLWIISPQRTIGGKYPNDEIMFLLALQVTNRYLYLLMVKTFLPSVAYLNIGHVCLLDGYSSCEAFIPFYDCETSSGNLEADIVLVAIKCDPSILRSRVFHSMIFTQKKPSKFSKWTSDIFSIIYSFSYVWPSFEYESVKHKILIDYCMPGNRTSPF
jgi:hypothetical protein